MKKIWIYIENGLFLEASSFGSNGTKVGEIVFNTSMSGYQEILSDPSYAGQFIVYTMPEIGNVGCNDNDLESDNIYSCGIIVRNYQDRYSNFRGEESLSDFLKKHNAIGICNVDTRMLTKTIRSSGSLMMIASTEISEKEELKKLLDKAHRIEDINFLEKVSTKNRYIHNSGTWNHAKMQYNKNIIKQKKIVAIDFGIKRNILNELSEAGLEVEVVPADFKAEELIKRYKNNEIKAVFLSNGPGDPLILKKEAREINLLVEAKIPIFAICLGHQLLSIARGYPTYKLKFGQHGGNHPVLNTKNSTVEITAQNHNYNVPESIKEIAEITHINLFDNTIEGLKFKDFPVFSVQHHPEASPGPHDSRYIFKKFADSL